MIIAFLLIPFINIGNFVPQTPLTVTGLLATIIIVYWPFTGFEISAIPVEETRDPALIRRSLITRDGYCGVPLPPSECCTYRQCWFRSPCCLTRSHWQLQPEYF